MISCTADKQKGILNRLKLLTNPETRVIKDLKDVLRHTSAELSTVVNSLEELLNIFTDKREELEKFLIDKSFIEPKTDSTAKTKTARTQPRVLAASVVSDNFRSSNFRALFTGSHIASLFFEQTTKEQVINALYIGDKSSKKYARPEELDRNVKILKNKLFKNIVDFLIRNGSLSKGDYYTEEIIEGEVTSKFNASIFSNNKFNKPNYDKHYVTVMKSLENLLLEDEGETLIIPGSDRRIPLLNGRIDEANSRDRLQAYNSLVLLQNFDSVVTNLFKNIITADLSTFGVLDDPLQGSKYTSKVKGLAIDYFLNDDVGSGGVKEIETKLVHTLVSTIPVIDSKDDFTGQYLNMNDLYGLGAALHTFQTENITSLLQIENWQTLEEDPLTMLKWNLEKIVKAYNSG
jgi:hypothetical protein